LKRGIVAFIIFTKESNRGIITSNLSSSTQLTFPSSAQNKQQKQLPENHPQPPSWGKHRRELFTISIITSLTTAAQ